MGQINSGVDKEIHSIPSLIKLLHIVRLVIRLGQYMAGSGNLDILKTTIKQLVFKTSWIGNHRQEVTNLCKKYVLC